MKHNKIHIIGGPGSGKSFFARQLFEKLSIPSYDLDNIFWDQKANDYNTKTEERIRGKLLGEIMKKDRWVVEGVYYRWVNESFEGADKIVILNTPLAVRNWRIFVRFIKRKMRIVKSKSEKFTDFVNLFLWNSKFDSDNLIRIRSHLQKYNDKIIEIKTKKQAQEFLEVLNCN